MRHTESFQLHPPPPLLRLHGGSMTQQGSVEQALDAPLWSRPWMLLGGGSLDKGYLGVSMWLKESVSLIMVSRKIDNEI